MLEIGRVCIKTAGREAGRACVVIDKIDDTYVVVTGPKSLTRVKRRKCNIAHLEPLEFQLKLAKNAADTEVEKLLQAEKILDKLTAKPVARHERPKVEEKAVKAEKKSIRERLLGRVKREEKPEKPKEEKAPEKKPEKPEKEEKKSEKPEKLVKKPKQKTKKAVKKKVKKPARGPKKKAKPAKRK